MKVYDAIVVGLGGVGSATLYEFARRGMNVLGIEQFNEIGHSRGSSHGETRIYRQAYFEHPNYVPLLKRAYELWHELNDRANRKLFCEVGLLEVGPADGVVIPGIRESVAQHRLQIEEFDHQNFQEAFPQFRKDESSVALFEPTAGYLLVEECIRQYVRMAVEMGAEVVTNSKVQSIETSEAPRVTTNSEVFTAESLVLTVGSWVQQFVPVPVRLVRKHMDWLKCDDARYATKCPAFFFEESDGYFYGFPAISGQLKVAEHSGGEPITNPNALDDAADPHSQHRIDLFVQHRLPGVSTNRTAHSTCMYSVTPDEHFIVDLHPNHSSIAIVGGLSGHGFKFAPALAESVLDLLEGNPCTKRNLAFLSLSRFHTDGYI